MSIFNQIKNEMDLLFCYSKSNDSILDCFDCEGFADRIKGEQDTDKIIREISFMIRESQDKLISFFKNYLDEGDR